MNSEEFEFTSTIYPSEVGKGGAYVKFPYDIKDLFGKGRVKVSVCFDEVPYEGSIVNMGVKNDDGSIAYIIGIRKDIRKKLKKEIGDKITVSVKERE